MSASSNHSSTPGPSPPPRRPAPLVRVLACAACAAFTLAWFVLPAPAPDAPSFPSPSSSSDIRPRLPIPPSPFRSIANRPANPSPTPPPALSPVALATASAWPPAPPSLEQALPDAELLEERLPAPDHHGITRRLRLLRIPGKYPVVRSETWLDSSGRVVHSATVVADQVLVALQPGATPSLLSQRLNALGLGRIHRKLFGAETYLVQLTAPSLDAVPVAIERLQSETGLVRTVDPNGVGMGGGIPNDPHFANQWHLHNPSGRDIAASLAWSTRSGSPDVTIAILDSGIDLSHPDLAPNLWINPGEPHENQSDDDHNGLVDDRHGWDFVSDDPTPLDDHGHGTHVSGILAARGNNGAGVAGVTWSARLMILKVLNERNFGYSSDLTDALRYALTHPHPPGILNLSLINYPHIDDQFAALQTAAERGILVVVSAGNSVNNNDLRPNYPSSYPLPNILAVAASDSTDQLCGFSSFGRRSVDLAAPGAGVFSAVLNGQFASWSGTSMAAPQVSGAAALLLQRSPHWNASHLKDALLASADPRPALAGRIGTGGRLNVAAALAHQPIPPPWDSVSLGTTDLFHFASWDSSRSVMRLRAAGQGLLPPTREDQARFLFQNVRGDASLETAIPAFQPVTDASTAGLTFRASAGPVASHVSLLVGADTLLFVERAPAASDATVLTLGPVPAGATYRLVRTGSLITALSTTDAVRWNVLHVGTWPHSGPAMAGLICNSGDPDRLALAEFAHPSLGSASEAIPVTTLGEWSLSDASPPSSLLPAHSHPALPGIVATRNPRRASALGQQGWGFRQLPTGSPLAGLAATETAFDLDLQVAPTWRLALSELKLAVHKHVGPPVSVGVALETGASQPPILLASTTLAGDRTFESVSLPLNTILAPGAHRLRVIFLLESHWPLFSLHLKNQGSQPAIALTGKVVSP